MINRQLISRTSSSKIHKGRLTLFWSCAGGGAAAGAAGSSIGVPIGSALLLAFDIEEPRHICMSFSLAKSSRCGSCCSSEYRRSQTAPATCNAQLAVSGGRNERGASKE